MCSLSSAGRTPSLEKLWRSGRPVCKRIARLTTDKQVVPISPNRGLEFVGQSTTPAYFLELTVSQNELQINAFKSNLDRKNSFSVFRSLSQARPTIETSKAWRDFYSNLTTPVESLTKDIALFGPYKLMPGTGRSNPNVLEISALTFDIDYSQGYIATQRLAQTAFLRSKSVSTRNTSLRQVEQYLTPSG